MKFIADLHIHSHYSLATSKHLTPEYLDYWAQLKGIDVVGTGDCTHPAWLNELKIKLEPAGNGLYRLKPEYKLKSSEAYLPPKTKRDVYFILTGEISSIYKKAGKVRKVHNVCVFPDFDSVEKLQEKLSKLGNITSDGRPILGVDAKHIFEITLTTSALSFLIPAHIWTPWFSVLGDKSGFNTLEECYEDLTPYIFTVETGLSSDPPMNWACSFLDNFRLVSNSDAHSPEKLGREANMFDTELSYEGMYRALKFDKGFTGTIEFFPQEGKYHYDGHRKCNICWTPLETVEHDGVCTVCGKPVTRGVMYRVAELADRKNILEAKNRKEFYSITSLPDIVAEVMGVAATSKKAKQAYFSVLDKSGSDFYTLLHAPIDEIRRSCGELLAEGIRRMRSAEVQFEEGYDGEFGRITAFCKGEINDRAQVSLLKETKSRQGPEALNRLSIKFDIGAFKARAGNAGALPGSSAPAQKQEKRPAVRLDEQSRAIGHNQGVCMVIAGPGAGKTHVLTERIVRLVQEGVAAKDAVLALTFSNKAAEEMRSRVAARLPSGEAVISTFHAFGLSLLKEHYQEFTIIDEDEKQLIIEEAGAQALLKKLKQISDHKQGISTDEAVLPFLNEYDALLRKHKVFDIDDLLFLSARLLRENNAARLRVRARFPWVLVDEYQDINPVQYELLTLVAGGGNPNLFVIGDPDQAIYGFRGSDVRFIAQLKKAYPEAVEIALPRSFRCPSIVLRAAGQVLGKGTYLEGNPLALKIEVAESETDKGEADLVAARIEQMIGGVRSFSRDSGVSDGTEAEGIQSFSDFAVLCRTSAQFGPLLKAFGDHGIPAQVIGGETFLKEEPFSTALMRLRSACRGSGEEELLQEMMKKQEPLGTVLAFLIKNQEVSETDWKRFVALGERFGCDYHEFLQNSALRKGVDDVDSRSESVFLMTMHSSKGLEFKAVFIPACEEGIIPFEMYGKKSREELEEEKRLLYVAATRTKKYLFLSHAKRRMFNGRPVQLRKSSLLEHLEKKLINEESRKPLKQDDQLDFKFSE